MTAKTPGVGDLSGQSRVRIFRISADMTGEAATTAIPHYIVAVLGLRLSDVATGTLFAQHRIRNSVAESLQAGLVILFARLIEYLPCNLDETASGMHQAFIYRRHPVGVAVAAGALRIVKFTREGD